MEKKEKSNKHKKQIYLNVCFICVLGVLCCSMWVFLYGPFCHGALKLDFFNLY